MKDFKSESFCFLLSWMSEIVDSCSVMTLVFQLNQILNFSSNLQIAIYLENLSSLF